MKVSLLSSTPDPEKVVTVAAKLCYSDSTIAELEDKVRNISVEKFLDKILSMGHNSILEHASFSFGIDGISRVTSHQLVRHRVASYSQQSQRYVNLAGSDEYVVPDTIAGDDAINTEYREFLKKVHAFYSKMVEAGIPKEDARYLLPNAACTKIIVTMNARELLHFFKLRCCERAQWEIRDMATRMLMLAKEAAPIIFKDGGPSCVPGPCAEGKMTCGKPLETRKKFKEM
ncbi:Thymidylate synthase ThyX [hydrothermal vent metagenome]|uniref:Thymidylate synthase ThyX n=1 Tax=hydrothermal vent metagenome TaxID=652676 RepID=A0A3B0QY66_9ZZZZ